MELIFKVRDFSSLSLHLRSAYLLKRLLMWYYGRKISKNERKLASLKKKKETILEEVQDKETYKVAKQILEKFAPEQLRRSPVSLWV